MENEGAGTSELRNRGDYKIWLDYVKFTDS